MVTLLVLVIALSAAGAVFGAAQLVAQRSGSLQRRLGDVRALGTVAAAPASERRERRRARVEALLAEVGNALPRARQSAARSTEVLRWAGFSGPSAPAVYWGARVVLTVAFAALPFAFLPFSGAGPGTFVFAALYGLALGMLAPALYVRRRARLRQHALELALPDALDMLVICVEAGLALNQALLRVAEECRTFSPPLQRQLALVNLEIQAGLPREQALRNLADRTGVADVRSLVTMLIQADRFGTSIAQSLRVHSETLRMKRRQRAEEAAAKTTIKLVFPLVFCIFPALFVIILGGGIIQIFKAFGGLG